MTEWWQPSFDPMDALVDLSRRVHLLELNQKAIIEAQNDLGSSMKQLLEQHNTIINMMKDTQNGK